MVLNKKKKDLANLNPFIHHIHQGQSSKHIIVWQSFLSSITGLWFFPKLACHLIEDKLHTIPPHGIAHFFPFFSASPPPSPPLFGWSSLVNLGHTSEQHHILPTISKKYIFFYKTILQIFKYSIQIMLSHMKCHQPCLGNHHLQLHYYWTWKIRFPHYP